MLSKSEAGFSVKLNVDLLIEYLHILFCVERRLSAAAAAARVSVAGGDNCDKDVSDKVEHVSLDDNHDEEDDDDDEYGFDPKLHVWHPPENPAITEERPDGMSTAPDFSTDVV